MGNLVVLGPARGFLSRFGLKPELGLVQQGGRVNNGIPLNLMYGYLAEWTVAILLHVKVAHIVPTGWWNATEGAP